METPLAIARRISRPKGEDAPGEGRHIVHAENATRLDDAMESLKNG